MSKEIDVNYINGYLKAIALLREYTTQEVSFNFYFKQLADGESITISFGKEVYQSITGPLKGSNIDRKINKYMSGIIEFHEIKNWEDKIITELDDWTGVIFTNKFKKESITNVWKNKPELMSIQLVKLLEDFFSNEEIKAYRYSGEISKELYYSWGGLSWIDLIFTNKKKNYLLHFDLCD